MAATLPLSTDEGVRRQRTGRRVRAGRRRRPRRQRARSSSTWSGPASAARTSSSSPATMAYLHTGHARYPMRIGHEWCGVVVRRSATAWTERWIGRRVTGDTMLGCGRCRRCLSGPPARLRGPVRDRHPQRLAGALAEQLVVPATALHALPDAVDAALGALVEPGGNALRAVRGRRPVARASGCSCWDPGRSACSSRCSPGPAGAEVHAARPRRSARWPSPASSASPRRGRASDAARRAVRRGHRRVQRRRAAGPRARPGRARQARRLHRPRRHAEHDRHPYARAQGRDRGRDPERVARAWPGRSSCTPPAPSTRDRSSPPRSASSSVADVLAGSAPG